MKLRLSLLGMAGGVLTGISVLVLLQQAGLVYPTRVVTILSAVLGLAWGIAWPSLRRTRHVRAYQRRLAR